MRPIAVICDELKAAREAYRHAPTQDNVDACERLHVEMETSGYHLDATGVLHCLHLPVRGAA